MGFFDYLPCCGPRKKPASASPHTDPEAAALLPPPREASIISDTGYGSIGGEGGIGPSNLSHEQKKRIEDIGRAAGNHMLPITTVRTLPSPTPRQQSSSSASSSRPSSPSPMRPETSPPDGMMRTSDLERAGDDPDGAVVRKTLFAPGTRSVSSRSRGRGRGRGKAK